MRDCFPKPDHMILQLRLEKEALTREIETMRRDAATYRQTIANLRYRLDLAEADLRL